MQNRFEDPKTGDTYTWQRNHTAEEDMGRTRGVSHAATTSGTGMVRQQGEDGPLVLKWQGIIEYRAQYQEMWKWFELSRSQTIVVQDYDANRYEVIVTSFMPKRVRKMSFHGRDKANTPWHYWEYTIEMEIVKPLWGDLVVAGVDP